MQKTFQYEGITINYEVQGTGTPVILLHGFGEDSSIWNNQIQALAAYCRVFVPDLPGSGQSGLLKPYATMDDQAKCVHALAKNEHLDQFVLLAHSMGGYISLAYAEKYPCTLLGLGLLHSTAFADSEEKKETRKKGIELIKNYGGYSFLKNTIPNLFSGNFKKEHPQQITDLIEKGKLFSNEALIQYNEMMIARPDRTAVLQNSTVPVLFIIGTEDIAAPLNDLMKQVSLPKISYMHILEGVGHMGMLEDPVKFNNHIIHFVKSLTR